MILGLTIQVLVLYLLAALVPAAYLLIYVWRHDTIEKEPPSLLLRLLIAGVAAALLSIVLEKIGEEVLNSYITQDSPYYIAFLAFFVIALVEEGTKYVMMLLFTWRNPNFNYRFDAIVYAVFTSLGFAAFENVLYIFNYGLSIAPTRALLSIPGHMAFAVYMGYFYGRAKYWHDIHEKGKMLACLIGSFLVSVILHGIYDTCALNGSARSTVFFFAFVMVFYLAAFRTIRKESWSDGPV